MSRRLILVALSLLVFGLGWAAFAPISAAREKLFEIPPGTSERRLAGEDNEILPPTIRLGTGDVLEELLDVLVERFEEGAVRDALAGALERRLATVLGD